MARLAVVGLWHLGCVAAAALAQLGHSVRATDPDRKTLRKLQQGVPPVHEPGLAEALAEQMREGRLAFCSSESEAFTNAEYIFLTFDTPVDENDQSNLAPIFVACDTIAWDALAGVQIVVMSQVPVGTCEQLIGRLRVRAPRLPFSLVYLPENLRLGQALQTFLQPDFLLVGAEDAASVERLWPLFAGMTAPRLTMSLRSAEMSKHALNAFLATSISFVNELADLAEACGVDVRDVVRVLRHDRRIGPLAFLNPGPGFSGGTLARDVQTLRRLAGDAGRSTAQLDATLAVNAARLPSLVQKLARACGGLRGRRVGLLGLTYKPGTNTLRRSHALELARMLLAEGAEVQAFDPQVNHPLSDPQGLVLCADAYQAAEAADAVVLATPCPEFKSLDLVRLRRAVRQPVILDAHNFLDDGAARRAGFHYCGVGIAEEVAARAGSEVGR
jgi:UDPglucose 6-dehydrogenase